MNAEGIILIAVSQIILCTYLIYNLRVWLQLWSLIGKVATNRFSAKAWSEMLGKWRVWKGKLRKAATGAAATAGKTWTYQWIRAYIVEDPCCQMLILLSDMLGLSPLNSYFNFLSECTSTHPNFDFIFGNFFSIFELNKMKGNWG